MPAASLDGHADLTSRRSQACRLLSARRRRSLRVPGLAGPVASGPRATAVQLPGREARADEPLVTRSRSRREAIADALAPRSIARVCSTATRSERHRVCHRRRPSRARRAAAGAPGGGRRATPRPSPLDAVDGGRLARLPRVRRGRRHVAARLRRSRERARSRSGPEPMRRCWPAGRTGATSRSTCQSPS